MGMEEFKDQLPSEDVAKMKEKITEVSDKLQDKENMDPEDIKKTVSDLQQSSLKLLEISFRIRRTWIQRILRRQSPIFSSHHSNCSRWRTRRWQLTRTPLHPQTALTHQRRNPILHKNLHLHLLHHLHSFC